MGRIQKRTAIAASALVLVLGAGGLAARSPSVRLHLWAGYQALRDPHRLDPAPRECAPAAAPVPEIEQPEISADFGRPTDEDLQGDGGATIATLTLPELPIPLSQRTVRFMRYFAVDENGRKAFAERFRRAGRYRPVIEQALRDAGLPEDLEWLVAIESGYNPQAVSRKGATGLFQFMPETAAKYGLTMSETCDERRSIRRSTDAAVAHLRDLFARYQSWELALAAYNFGADPLDDAIGKLVAKRPKSDKDQPVTLKDLAEAKLIPKETANFVPQVQAFAIVAANRGRFGLDDLDTATPFEIGELAVPEGTHLATVARATGVPVSLLRDYNPELIRDRAPDDGGDYIVSIPADRVAQARAALPSALSREREEAEREGARVAATAGSGAPTSSAAPSASAASKAATPKLDRFVLPNGVAIERLELPTASETIEARFQLGSARAAAKDADGSFAIAPITVPAGALDTGLGHAADELTKLLGDGGEIEPALLRRLAEPRRRALSKMPYGSAWLALAGALFPDGSPLAGTLAGPTEPLSDLLILSDRPRAPLRTIVAVTGPASHDAVAAAAERAFGGVLDDGAPVAPPREAKRLSVSEPVPYQRVLVAWLAPADRDGAGGPLRLAIALLSHSKVGAATRALALDHKLAAQVRGFLDLGPRASVAAIELVPAVPHDADEVERGLDQAIDAFAESGPSDADLTVAKAIVRERLVRDKARAGAGGEPRDAALARIDRAIAEVDAASAADVRAMVKRAFGREGRVVVVTEPKR